ncbi:MAG: GNAT family N-acetyltransferase [Janthinobacterium lividum]
MDITKSPRTTDPRTLSRQAGPCNETFHVRVKVLSERDRRRLLHHFLELDRADRMLRFGSELSDELVTRYVQKLNFTRDSIFGVYDARFKLVGVGHLAFSPREALPRGQVSQKETVAELGVSVSACARGMGVGSKLFERAAIRCRNADVDTLFMQCLSSNRTMMHIARKAGMTIQRAHGEADAYLKVEPASAGSVLQEAMAEQVALIDYAFKANARAASKWLASFASERKK